MAADRGSARGVLQGKKGFGELPLSQAAVACGLGGSLEWLAGADVEPGGPADPDVRFAPDALRAAAQQAGVKLEALRAKAKLDVSGWRAIMAGKQSLAQLHQWSGHLRLMPTALTTVARA